jgi:hypothetical protein
LQGHPQGEQLYVHAHCTKAVLPDTDRRLPENPENQIYQQTGKLFLLQLSIGEFSCGSKFLEKRKLLDKVRGLLAFINFFEKLRQDFGKKAQDDYV